MRFPRAIVVELAVRPERTGLPIHPKVSDRTHRAGNPRPSAMRSRLVLESGLAVTIHAAIGGLARTHALRRRAASATTGHHLRRVV